MKTEALYQAKRSMLERIHANMVSGSTTYTEAAVADIFDDMKDLFPAGAKVTAVYYESIFEAEPKTIEGTVLYSVRLDDSEPCFEIEVEQGFPIMLKGSLLTLVD